MEVFLKKKKDNKCIAAIQRQALEKYVKKKMADKLGAGHRDKIWYK